MGDWTAVGSEQSRASGMAAHAGAPSEGRVAGWIPRLPAVMTRQGGTCCRGQRACGDRCRGRRGMATGVEAGGRAALSCRGRNAGRYCDHGNGKAG